MTVAGDPNSLPGGPGSIQSLWDWIHARPLARFVVSEIIGGIASLTVYAFFLMVSLVAEWLTGHFSLRNQAPAQYLDFVFAWCAAISGSITFAMITLAELFRLARHLFRSERQ